MAASEWYELDTLTQALADLRARREGAKSVGSDEVVERIEQEAALMEERRDQLLAQLAKVVTHTGEPNENKAAADHVELRPSEKDAGAKGVTILAAVTAAAKVESRPLRRRVPRTPSPHVRCYPARVQRLMQLAGQVAIYQRPNTSKPAPAHKIYPYLLGGISIERVNQVWCADVTYIPMAPGRRSWRMARKRRR